MNKPTLRIAEHMADTLAKVVSLNEKHDGELIKPSYIDAINRARKTIQRRLAYDEFPRNDDQTV